MKQNKKFVCHNCNFSLSGSEKFCPECGSKLISSCPEPKSPVAPSSSKLNYYDLHKKNKQNSILDPDDSTLEWYIGPDQDTSWYEAIEWLNNLKIKTGKEWKMPTRSTLRGLYDNCVSSHCKIKPTSSSWLWVWTGEKANNQSLNNLQMAWGFDFRCGLEFWGGCSESLCSRVFAVRSIQKNKTV